MFHLKGACNCYAAAVCFFCCAISLGGSAKTFWRGLSQPVAEDRPETVGLGDNRYGCSKKPGKAAGLALLLAS